MRWLLTALPALMCGAMMLVICVPMLLGRKHRRDQESASKEEIGALREEVSRLRAERAQHLGRDERV